MSETDNDNNTTPGADGQEGLRPPDVFDDEELLSPPVRRAAYSDRTAWLMAAMSELAYFRFEGGEDFKSLALDLIRITSPGDVEDRLKRFLRQMNAGTTEGRNALKATLKAAGFELVNVYNVADTQAFLARKPATSAADGMRILAFRGTESDKWRDIKTDVDAILVHPEDGLVSEQIHSGFYKAFCGIRKKIEKDLEKDPHLPLYVTGHSLGGALAIVATRFIAADSLGACYTFGAPRVGNVHMGQVFKTPIYRVVNAADAVPRLPPVHVTPLLIALFKLLHWVPFVGVVVTALERFQGYIDFGDMRYLTHADDKPGGGIGDFQFVPNASLPFRASRSIPRWIATRGRAAVGDHAISLYRKKLKAYAIFRNRGEWP